MLYSAWPLDFTLQSLNSQNYMNSQYFHKKSWIHNNMWILNYQQHFSNLNREPEVIFESKSQYVKRSVLTKSTDQLDQLDQLDRC